MNILPFYRFNNDLSVFNGCPLRTIWFLNLIRSLCNQSGNPDLHRQILETWRRDSPKMVARLEKQGTLEDLAFVCQERMWRAAKDNRKAGLPVTDAREQAERDHLMLEPEEPEALETWAE